MVLPLSANRFRQTTSPQAHRQHSTANGSPIRIFETETNIRACGGGGLGRTDIRAIALDFGLVACVLGGGWGIFCIGAGGQHLNGFFRSSRS